MYWPVFERFYSFAVWVVCFYCSPRCSFIYYLCIGFFVPSPLLKRKRLNARKLNVWRGVLAFSAWVWKSTEQNRTERAALEIQLSNIGPECGETCTRMSSARTTFGKLFVKLCSLRGTVELSSFVCSAKHEKRKSMSRSQFYGREHVSHKKKTSWTYSWPNVAADTCHTFYVLLVQIQRTTANIGTSASESRDAPTTRWFVMSSIEHPHSKLLFFFFGKLAATATLPYCGRGQPHRCMKLTEKHSFCIHFQAQTAPFFACNFHATQKCRRGHEQQTGSLSKWIVCWIQ